MSSSVSFFCWSVLTFFSSTVLLTECKGLRSLYFVLFVAVGQLLSPLLSIGLVVPDGSSSPKEITALSCKLYHYDIIVKVLFYTGELLAVSCTYHYKGLCLPLPVALVFIDVVYRPACH